MEDQETSESIWKHWSSGRSTNINTDLLLLWYQCGGRCDYQTRTPKEDERNNSSHELSLGASFNSRQVYHFKGGGQILRHLCRLAQSFSSVSSPLAQSACFSGAWISRRRHQCPLCIVAQPLLLWHPHSKVVVGWSKLKPPAESKVSQPKAFHLEGSDSIG